MSFDHLVYLRVFEGCNLYCEHCFIPQNPKRMTLEQVAGMPSSMEALIGRDKRLEVRWHGGEPTLLGLEWFRDAVAAVDANAGGLSISHSIQTNLLSYSTGWGQLYRERFNGAIGVSWDPAIRHLRVAGELSNHDYEVVFQEKLAQAVSDGLDVSLVVTVTKPLVSRYGAADLLRRFGEWGVRSVSFERITATGEARKNWAAVGLSNSEHAEFMAKLFRAYKLMQRSGRIDFRASPFDSLEAAINRGGESSVCFSGSCDGSFHTFDASGYKKGCTALTAEIDNRRAIHGIVFVRKFTQERGRRLEDAGCGDCGFKGSVCNTGCLASAPLDGSGECSGYRGLLSEIKRFGEKGITQ